MKRKHSILGLSVGVLFVAAMVVQGQIPDYLFSTDIGSDLDISDPITPPNNWMDAGAIYRPGPVIWKDDDSPTPQWPGHPFASAPQPAPGQIGTSTIAEYHQYFDLDAEDQLLNEAVVPGQISPLAALESVGIYSIYKPVHFSLDDDGAPGWAVTGDVPTTAAPDRAIEIFGTMLALPNPLPPAENPLVDEMGLGLGPNPPEGMNDDDVDALDWHPLFEDPLQGFQARYFSPDHEADLGLDPGSIYLTLRNAGQNVAQVFDDVQSFGISEDADVDAFEFVAIDEGWAALLGIGLGSNDWTAAAIFSVDQDDPDTAIDESGGLNPNIIYLTDLLGNHVAASNPYSDDIDALTVIPEPAVLALIGLFGGGMLFVRRFFAM